MRGDGANDAKRRSLAELRGLNRFEAADVFVPLPAPPRPGGDGMLRYHVDVRRDGRTVALALPAVRAAPSDAPRRSVLTRTTLVSSALGTSGYGCVVDDTA